MRLPWFLAILAPIVMPGPAAGQANAGSAVTERFVMPGESTARLLAGHLSAPSSAAAATVVGGYLATRPEPIHGIEPKNLRARSIRSLPQGGAVVRLNQTAGGLDVLGAQVAVRLDAAGRVRWMSGRVVPEADKIPTRPKIDAAAAAFAAGSPGSAHDASLVIHAVGPGTPRLAWRVLLPRNVAKMQTLRVFVDAQTGKVFNVENLVRTDRQANVFEWNPAVSPQTTTTLEGLPPGLAAGAHLENADLQVRNCIDNRHCSTFETGFGTYNIHFCDIMPVAAADENGDFTALTYGSDTEPEDPFSEVQMFYHVGKVYDFFRGFGFESLTSTPLTAVVNLRIPSLDVSGVCVASGDPLTPWKPSPGSELHPFDNAAFMPKGTLGSFPPEDWIVFGQGEIRDLSYDGDVVYHEFTHAVMGTVSPELPAAIPDVAGVDPTPGGLHEGYADYFSAALTGDPEMGEYAGVGLVPMPLPSGALRSLGNDKVCPDDLWGETHQDGEAWAGALWDIREALAAENRRTFDQAVFEVMSTLGASDTQLSAAAATVAEVEVQLGPDARELARAKFAARGLDDCNGRIIDASAPGYTKDVMMLIGADEAGIAMVPGPVQFRIRLPADATEVKATLELYSSAGPFPGAMPSQLKLLLKPGSDGIRWSWPSASHDATASGDISGGEGPALGKVVGAFPAGDYVVMLANAGGGTIAVQTQFSFTEGMIEPDAGPMPDAGSVLTDAAAAVDAEWTCPHGKCDGDDDDCGCRVGGAPPVFPGGALLLLSLLAFWSRRRSTRATRRLRRHLEGAGRPGGPAPHPGASVRATRG